MKQAKFGLFPLKSESLGDLGTNELECLLQMKLCKC